MRFNERKRLDTTQIDDRRGESPSGGGGMGGLPGMGGAGGKMGLPMGKTGGALGLIIMLVLAFLSQRGGGGSTGSSGFGLPAADPSAQFDSAPRQGAMADSNLEQSCQTGADANRSQECRTVAVVNSVNAFWADEFKKRDMPAYQQAVTVLFGSNSGEEVQVSTGCGNASSAVGPFYCPADNKAYIDLGFFKELESKFGAKGGDFAEAYVIAHEYGHHIQNLTGVSEKVQKSGDMQGPESNAVRLELQADCYAGVWAANATTGPEPLLLDITEEDISEGIDAAQRVGDDFIQERFSGNVTPETWTHGSSAQRKKWFSTGLRTGEASDCDTFTTDRL
jgi:uncharacterized protein